MTDFENLKKALDSEGGCEEEWGRLDRDHYAKIEFAIQTHYINRHIPPGKSVIDIGGGPGRYAIALLERGNKVALVDLSDAFLRKAEEEIKKLNLTAGLLAIKQQNAVRLDAFGDSQFDHALLLGPVFYMDSYEEREKALLEAARVIKSGGLIFLTMLNNLRCVQEMFYVPDLRYRLAALKKYSATIDDVLNKSLDRADCVKQLIADCGLEITEMYGTDSVAGPAFDKINEMATSEENWRAILDILIKLSCDQSVIGLSTHTTYVLRKP